MTQTSDTSLMHDLKKTAYGAMASICILGGLTNIYNAGSQSIKFSETTIATMTLDGIAKEIRSEKNVNLENIASMRSFLTNIELSPSIYATVKKYNGVKSIPTATDALAVIETTKKELDQTSTGSYNLMWGLTQLAVGSYWIIRAFSKKNE